MAKRIVRLTEADLTRLIKKVLKEDMTSDPATVVKTCIEKNAPSVKIDISKISPSCITISQKVMSGQTPTGDELFKCGGYVASQLSSLGFEAFTKAPIIIDCIKSGLNK